MSDPSSPRRVLHLVVAGLSKERLGELTRSAEVSVGTTEILFLTEANAREALGKIFEADTIAVWGELAG